MQINHLSIENEATPESSWCTLIAYSQAIANLYSVNPEEVFQTAFSKLKASNFKHQTPFGEIELFDSEGGGLNIFLTPKSAEFALKWLFDEYNLDIILFSNRDNYFLHRYLIDTLAQVEVGVKILDDNHINQYVYNHSILLHYVKSEGVLRIHDSNFSYPLDYDPDILLKSVISTGESNYNYQLDNYVVAFFSKK